MSVVHHKRAHLPATRDASRRSKNPRKPRGSGRPGGLQAPSLEKVQELTPQGLFSFVLGLESNGKYG